MESQKITYAGTWSILCRQMHSIRLPIWLSSILLLLMVGCPAQPKKDSKSETAAKVGRGDLPPLKIGLLECGELSEVLQSRWQEFSDQPIEILNIDRLSLSQEPIPSLDVILYPANFLGSLSERDWIAPLPATLFQRLGGSAKSSKLSQELSEESGQGIENWSSRLRSIARYNGKWMGLPLGAPCWVALTRGLDIGPLEQLQQAIGRNQNSPAIAADTFETFLAKAETQLQGSLSDRTEKLKQLLQETQAIDKKALVARFLWIMSTSESRYRGLIDPYKVTPRLGLPEFARSARVLQRLALIEPSTILCPAVDAWEKVAEGRAVFGIGWPRSDGFQRDSLASNSQPLKLVPLLFNGGDGILASIGRKTRQSSMAAEFMHWLSREENRVAMQAKSPRVEVLEIDSDSNRIREDYRDYQTLQRLEAANTTLDMSPRFLLADVFADSLADTLLEILQQPQIAEAQLEECKTKWSRLIESTGPEILRTSLERATGFSN